MTNSWTALSSIVDLEYLRWLWLTHDDADHTGSIQRIMEAAPNATLVTHALGALRMATWWPVPMERVHAVRDGDEIHVGDRTLTAVAPRCSTTRRRLGLLDRSTGALFTVDAFGAIMPEATQNAADVPPEALAGGMVGWATRTRRGLTSSTARSSARSSTGSARLRRRGSSPRRRSRDGASGDRSSTSPNSPGR